MKTEDTLIACPACTWEPDGGAHWQCHCGQIWNTFLTVGKCPACRFVHKHTQCPACKVFSPHADWYIDLQVDISTLTEEIRALKASCGQG